MAAFHRYAVVIIVAAHYAHKTSFPDNPCKGVGVHHLQFPRGNLRVGTGKALACSLVGAVCEEVLGSGRYASIFLETFRHLYSEFRNKIR